MSKSVVIWKFLLTDTPSQTIDMPLGAEILSIQDIEGVLTLWAKVDPTEIKQSRIIENHRTGRYLDVESELGTRLVYLGTVQHRHFANHLFEKVIAKTSP